MPEESVKVAVRVRPFNAREKERNAKLIITMNGTQTKIKNPQNNEEKDFSFDYSYWSHDGFTEQADGLMLPSGPSSRYASQQKVYDNLGKGVLDNALEGYNCSLFAYGQTGSGKSYSMVGYGANKGIVPICCKGLFKIVSSNKDAAKKYLVTFSMIEIYNEQVRDLLNPNLKAASNLPIRENPAVGFYVDGLKRWPVGSYEEIEQRMNQGTANRTIAATNMNATSSRAHTVISITFDQIEKTDQGETKKSSVMNLIDLAGSERADSTGATGDRLKEGANINKSLSALGNVISALADSSSGVGAKKKIQVPYRDSVLTKLLKNALGGNSKTIMIAALSPADINFDETLSTLRYADRAKKIKNKAVVNESEMDKLIRELKEENEKLKAALSSGGQLPGQQVNTKGMSQEEIDKMRADMEAEIRANMMANADMIQQSTNWDKQLQEAQADLKSNQNAAQAGGASTGTDQAKLKSTVPYFENLNEDSQLAGMIRFFLEVKEVSIGRGESGAANTKNRWNLRGFNIQEQHAQIVQKKKTYEIRPVSSGTSKTLVNGTPLTGPIELTHKDRILFGSNHLYVFLNPKQTKCDKNLPETITWEFAQTEIAEASGFGTGDQKEGLSREQQIIHDQILEVLPMVSEVNAISEEMNKQRSFDIVLIAPKAQESTFGQVNTTKVMIKMLNLQNKNTWLWERGKFMNRRFMMQEIYQKYMDGEDVSKIEPERDPFWEPIEEVLVGTATGFLQPLSYNLDFEDKLVIVDYKGEDEGWLHVQIAPCDKQGALLSDDMCVDNPAELLNKPMHLRVTVNKACLIKSRFTRGIRVKYRMFRDSDYQDTGLVTGSLEPSFNQSKLFSFPKVTKEHLEYFNDWCITFMIYAAQEDSTSAFDPKLQNLNTKQLKQLQSGADAKANGSGKPSLLAQSSTGLDNLQELNKLRAEMAGLHRGYNELKRKERRLQQLCEEWAGKPPAEQQFSGFFEAVSSLAHSTQGSKFRTNAEVIVQLINTASAVRDQNSETGAASGSTNNKKQAAPAPAKTAGGAKVQAKKK